MLCSLHRALQFGNQYIYQAMPRMLTLWLDFGAKVYEFEKGKTKYPAIICSVKTKHINN